MAECRSSGDDHCKYRGSLDIESVTTKDARDLGPPCGVSDDSALDNDKHAERAIVSVEGWRA